MTQLTQHFSLDELTFSETAVRRGIDNTPDADVFANLQMLAAGLERVRAILGHSIHVSSGYRSPKLNSAIGGSKSSQHMQGLAADFTCPEFGSPLDVCIALEHERGYIGYDQLIQEGRWTHISFSDSPRGEVLTAHFGGGGVTYSTGLS
jgi:zinc D-Ala-D-Ala carboxypeptidase